MTEKEVEDFVNGKSCLVNNHDGTFTTEPISKGKGHCGCCGQTKKEMNTIFKVGDKVVYDSIRGSFGRYVGEGVIVDPKKYGSTDSCFMYLVDTGDYYRWYHHCQLNLLTET